MPENEVRIDVAGYDALTAALMDLLNEFPGLDGDAFGFAMLGDACDKAMFPTSGGIINAETRSITGHVHQVCAYPFIVIYRASGLSESRKAGVQEWLDTLGRWLERQPVMIDGQLEQLAEYPTLQDSRIIKNIRRTTPAHLDAEDAGGTEDWAIYISCDYENDFDT